MKAIVVVFFVIMDLFMIGVMLGKGGAQEEEVVAGDYRKITTRAPAYHKSPAKPDPRDKQAQLLALNIYHESKGLRGPGDIGWRSVAAVVFNRLEDERFPKTIEGVIYEYRGGACAFSWYCDGYSDRPLDVRLYRKILSETRKYLAEYERGVWEDPTNGAHSYHAITIAPNEYFQRLEPIRTIRVGAQGHVFYGDGGMRQIGVASKVALTF